MRSERVPTLTPHDLVALALADGRERIAAKAADAVKRMRWRARDEAERAARSAARRLSTLALVRVAERLYEQDHQRWCKLCDRADRLGNSGELIDAWLDSPATISGMMARQVLDERAVDAVRELMVLLEDALTSGDVRQFADAVRAWHRFPVCFRRYWMAWNHGSGVPDGGLALTERAGWDYDILAVEFTATAERLRSEHHGDAARTGKGTA